MTSNAIAKKFLESDILLTSCVANSDCNDKSLMASGMYRFEVKDNRKNALTCNIECFTKWLLGFLVLLEFDHQTQNFYF